MGWHRGVLQCYTQCDAHAGCCDLFLPRGALGLKATTYDVDVDPDQDLSTVPGTQPTPCMAVHVHADWVKAAGQAWVFHLPAEHLEMPRGVFVLYGPSVLSSRVHEHGHDWEESREPSRRHDCCHYTYGQSIGFANSSHDMRLLGPQSVLGHRTTSFIGGALLALLGLGAEHQPGRERPQPGSHREVVARMQFVFFLVA